MLKRLRLTNFKNFKDAQLTLGNLTILVGANASGKSNLRDAFRFLHGISRGYNLAEIIGEKWIEGGVLQWRGIRGGIREVTLQGESTFSLEVDFITKDINGTYKIEVDANSFGKPPKVVAEKLCVSGKTKYIFDSHPQNSPPKQDEESYLNVKVNNSNKGRNLNISFPNQRPIISQITKHPKIDSSIKKIINQAISAFSSMQFLDLNPDSMRLSSFPGQNILGDQGENLSSVLQSICEDPNLKESLIQWVETLTPMDAKDFEFTADQTGKILLTLIEKNGQKISAYSASDGTLRFLAMIAALLGVEPARFYFFEELENGIHPTRLNLLIGLIERKVNEGTIQMVATTHSSVLLKLLNEKTLESTSLTYRLENKPYSEIIRILDIPNAKQLIEDQTLSRLYESAWLENTMEFLDDEEAE